MTATNKTVSIPQGTRDFPAAVVRKRNYIFSCIRKVFEVYGFEPLETPAMENLDTLTGKYGDEGDKLIFKILNNGLNNEKNINSTRAGFEQLLAGKNSTDITERALKYDLTIPFARYVAMNLTRLTLPYRRYQIQPVWRADRPQKGRYREFTQCDADVVGSLSLLNETELANIYHDVFTTLKLNDYELRINNRKVLAALAAVCNGADKMTDITIAIDKLDKIGLENVKKELAERGLQSYQIEIIERYLCITGSNEEKIDKATVLLGNTESGKQGIEELGFLLAHATNVNLVVDLTLARGLNYYTGTIFEAKAPASVSIGSIGGGGRYDDLTGHFSVPGIPGVGISFGVDRIYDVLEELNLFPGVLEVGTRALFFNMGEPECLYAFDIMQGLRKNGIACELYYENVKIDKQFKYAEKKNIPFIVIIGSKEMNEGICQVKELSTGKQEVVPLAALHTYFNKT